MFKHGGKALAIVVCAIITKIVNLSYAPRNLNIGIVFPIIKDSKKSANDINNTRPITISDTLATIFEKYMLEVINNLWDDVELQFGFKKNCSTNHAIFMLRETLVYQKNRNRKSYICFMDFSKAFDKVVRSILLSKLSAFMDQAHWGSLFTYYKHSSVIVSNNGIQGDTIITTTGVKQGGPLSPKLFSIYVSAMVHEFIENYPHKSLGCNIILYADDTVIVQNSMIELQEAVNQISEYCKLHQIKINVSKTKYMITGNRWDSIHTIQLNNEELERVYKFKYLGWWLESNLDSKEHIKTRKLASTVASYQLRKIGFHNENMNPELKVMLRDTYCRSRLNYAIENTFMCAKNYNDLHVIECKILKSSLGLNRFHSNTLLNNALQITPLERHIKIRKIRFLIDLLENPVTLAVIERYIMNTRAIPRKSLISEVLSICGVNDQTLEVSEFKKLMHKKVKELEEKTKIETSSDTALAIGYLLKQTHSKLSKEVVKRLLHWENAMYIKPDHLKKKKRVNKNTTREATG